MNAIAHIVHGRDSVVTDLFARGTYSVVKWIDGVWHAAAAAHRQRRDLKYLSTLDDYHLADIGLTRSDLTSDGLAEAARQRDAAVARMRLMK